MTRAEDGRTTIVATHADKGRQLGGDALVGCGLVPGKWPLALTARLSFEFSVSMALAV